MKVAANFYTIFRTAQLAGVDAEKYLRYATKMRLSNQMPKLPHKWDSS